MKFRQSKDNNSSITDDSLTKHHIYNHNIVIYIQYKFQELPFIGYLVMAEDGKFRHSKGKKSDITDDTPVKFNVHKLTMVIYIQYFNKISTLVYLVMAGDTKKDGWTTPNQYPSAFGGDKKSKMTCPLEITYMN